MRPVFVLHGCDALYCTVRYVPAYAESVRGLVGITAAQSSRG